MERIAIESADARDLPDAARLLAACAAHDTPRDVHTPTAEALGEWVARVRPALACARRGGELVAWAYSTPSPCHRDDRVLHHFRIFVAPSERRRGIGGALLDWAEGLPRTGERPGLQCSVGVDWTAARGFLAHHGFETAYEDVNMRRPASDVCPVRVEGVVLRALFRARELESWRLLHHDAYRGDVDFQALDAEAALLTVERPGCSLEVAARGGLLLGFCMTLATPGEPPRIESLGVRPGARRRGLGRALLRRGLTVLGAHAESVELNVHAHNPAHALYVSEGFVETSRDLTLRRDSRAAG